MMKNLTIKLFAIVLLFSAFSLQAQDLKIPVNGQKKIIIKEINRVSVEAYDGNEIQVVSAASKEKSERAEGLKALSARGEDNTGIGLNMKSEANEITLYQVVAREDGKYTIKVPKSMNVHIEHNGSWEGGKIEVYRVTGELEISGKYNSVHLEDINGPALVSTVYGEIVAKFSSLSQTGPTSIVSIYGDVDITLPANTKADISAKTPYGEAYSDLNIEFPKTDGLKKVSSVVEGKLNGGGVKLELKASYENIYLRKK